MKLSLKPLAVLRPSATGNEKIDKLWSQVRSVILFAGGALAAIGWINADADVNGVVDMLSKLIDNGYIIVGEVMAIIAAVSSWFAKEK